MSRNLDATTPVREAYDAWLTDAARKKNASTCYNYRVAVEPLVEQLPDDTPVSEIDENDLEEYIDDLVDDTDYQSSTIATRYQNVKAFFKWLYQNERIIDRNPTARVSVYEWEGIGRNSHRKAEELRAKEQIIYTESEHVEQIAANVRPPRLRNELMVRLAFQTGARASELVEIKRSDVTEEYRHISLITKKRQKQKFRDVWYGESLDILMDKWLSKRESMLTSSCPYLFISNRDSTQEGSSRLTAHTFNEIVKDAADEAGIQEDVYLAADGEYRKKFTAHTLRHGFGVYCVRDHGDGGMDIRTLQMLMGHASIETTSKYLQFKNETLRRKSRRHAPE